jgi:LAO/AO transport system kinase
VKKISRDRLNLQEYQNGLASHNKIILAKAITLVESRLSSDEQLAEDLIESILVHTGKSIRIGITGSPGVGKSTFIETFGKYLTQQNMRVAVLAIDPSSTVTQGSILGDKTRMEELAKDPLAFIRPTASRNALGGVAHKTREAILLCEAAGFDVILVETVGVGQSETIVRSMVDFFLLLMLAGSGDELQGIKKGIMEMADGVVITKADGDNKKRAKEAQAHFLHALHLFQLPDSGWSPHVLTASALQKEGIEEVWEMITSFQAHALQNGWFNEQRKKQDAAWFSETIQNQALSFLLSNSTIQEKKLQLESAIAEKKITPPHASRQLMQEILSRFKV